MNKRTRKKLKHGIMNLCFRIAYDDKAITRKTHKRLCTLLRMEIRTKPYMADYGYSADTAQQLLNHIEYCSDRMNPGRARAILRMLCENRPVRHGVYKVIGTTRNWTMHQYNAGMACIVGSALVPFDQAPPEAQERTLAALIRGTKT